MRATLAPALPLLLAFGACGDDPPAATPNNFQELSDTIFQKSCAFSTSCHSDAGVTGAKFNICANPLLDPAGRTICRSSSTLRGAYDAILFLEPSNGPAKAEGMLVVTPCRPDKSFMLTKLRLPESATDPDMGYGEHMPKNAGTLPESYIQAISDWIARGAHLDEPEDVTGTTCNYADMSVPDFAADLAKPPDLVSPPDLVGQPPADLAVVD
jgi:hypothetical protein